MKPELPPEIAKLFPPSIVSHIYSYVPHLPKQKGSPLPCTISPNMERDLRVLQHSIMRGKNEMWLRDFDDFVLDRPVVKKSPVATAHRRLEVV